MRVAITGGTGFLGSHLAKALTDDGVVILSRRTGADLNNPKSLAEALVGCDVVAHLAGINRELGDQTYQKVHVDGTANVIRAARAAGVKKIILLSFIKARPNCGSPYHESKWAAEELVRNSGLNYTIIKAGMVYGRGDHLLDHITHSLYTVPLFPSVGMFEKPIRPVPVGELTKVLVAAVHGALENESVAVLGAEELSLSEAVRRVGVIVDRRVIVFPLPILFHKVLAQFTEWTMKVPLVAKAQVRMLAEGVTEPGYKTVELPESLKPKLPFWGEHVDKELPERRAFGMRDLRIPQFLKHN